MQFAIVACALLGVALGQYTGFPGYQGYQGYPGYQGYNQGYNKYPGYTGYPGYNGYNGYQGYQGYPGFQGYRPQVSPVKPVEVKKETSEKIQEIIKPTVVPVVPVVPVVRPVVQGVYNPIAAGPYYGIRSQQQDSSPDGAYQYSFETENGIAVAERGVPSVGPAGEEEVVTGQYSYTAPDGQVITVRYTADKDGFHPEGAHLPGSSAYTAEPYRPYGYQKSLPIFAPVEAPVVPAVVKPVVAVAEKKEE